METHAHGYVHRDTHVHTQVHATKRYTHRGLNTFQTLIHETRLIMYPQLFLASDLSPLIRKAKLALSIQPKRKHLETLTFQIKEGLIHFTRTFIWANAFTEEN